MRVAPIQRTNVSDEIADQLRRQILTGELKPGDKLPPERELALKFGTNRNTLREALRILEAVGLVHIRQGAPMEIADIASEGRLELLPYLVMYSQPTPDFIRPLRHAMRFRQMLLSEAAAASAETATAADVEELRFISENVREIQGSVEEQELEYTFYAALIRMTRSITFQWTYNSFAPAYREMVRRGGRLWKLPGWTGDSRDRVLDAIAKKDPELARKRLYDHFEKLDTEMFRVFTRTQKAAKGS